jgi:hypothetical protein
MASVRQHVGRLDLVVSRQKEGLPVRHGRFTAGSAVLAVLGGARRCSAVLGGGDVAPDVGPAGPSRPIGGA